MGPPHATAGSRVCVIGAGIAGLVTTKVLLYVGLAGSIAASALYVREGVRELAKRA